MLSQSHNQLYKTIKNDNVSIELYLANALKIPRENESIDCVVTSPPYWGLRDYGTGEWIGGINDCDHLQVNDVRKNVKQTTSVGTTKLGYKGICKKCGAKRIDKQIGLEETPEEYVKTMVNVFKEVWRVLKPTGTVWLNLGDSYSSFRATGTSDNENVGSAKVTGNLKPKDLVGIPWRVALALQADGWYIRSDIIWHKPNPMPESVKDRPTRSHEYIFLLTKSEKYYYDYMAISEPIKDSTLDRYKYGWNGDQNRDYPSGDQNNLSAFFGSKKSQKATVRNKRDVWTIHTQAYAEAHFATFPEKLIEPCILAGSPKGGMVLDLFVGSGTTMVAAIKNHRNGIGIDINSKYLEIAINRINGSTQKLF